MLYSDAPSSRALANAPGVFAVSCHSCVSCSGVLLHQHITGAAAFQGSQGCIGILWGTEAGQAHTAKSNANYKRTKILLICLEKSMKFQGLKQADFDEYRYRELVLELTLKKFKYL